MTVQLIPVEGIGEITKGDDLASVILESMAAGVNDAINVDATANVIQISSAQDGDRQASGQRSQRLSH